MHGSFIFRMDSHILIVGCELEEGFALCVGFERVLAGLVEAWCSLPALQPLLRKSSKERERFCETSLAPLTCVSRLQPSAT